MSLNEDEIDDILYSSRINNPQDLFGYLTESAQRHSGDATKRLDVLAAAIDPENGNTILHYAGANGHTGN